MITWPTRAPPAFGETESPTVPLPSPDCPWVTVIQLALVVAVHRQPESVVIPTLNRPPLSPIVSFVRDKEKTHAAACCVTATRWEPTTIAPVRGAGTVLAATV
jgi:hypothetical protein